MKEAKRTGARGQKFRAGACSSGRSIADKGARIQRRALLVKDKSPVTQEGVGRANFARGATDPFPRRAIVKNKKLAERPRER